MNCLICIKLLLLSYGHESLFWNMSVGEFFNKNEAWVSTFSVVVIFNVEVEFTFFRTAGLYKGVEITWFCQITYKA